LSQDRSAAAPLYEVIHDVLREHIAERRLAHGLVLSESSIARAFGASRVPVRAALQRLRADGLVCDFKGRGYLVGPDGAPPVRMGLTEAGFRLPRRLKIRLSARNRWERIYPEVEHAVAICLAYGRFMLNESSLAEYYAVSRTVAHEVLTKLERAGIVSRDQNQRWYAGPLTEKNVREHFEIRWLLEPVALRQAFPRLDLVKLERKRDRVARIKDGLSSPDELERIESDLHIEAISQCDNALVLETVRRSQLPLFAAHTTFHQYQRREDIKMMVSDHTSILDRLLIGQLASASGMLEAHIKRSLEPCIEIWRGLSEIPEKMLPTYMVQVDRR
jgi:DNA-binding GntR family transcriptional regulator